MATILIVDDEKSLRVTLGEFLREAGHHVETAEDVAGAERLLAGRLFDVVVADIILPKVSGVDLLKRIRTKAPDTQVILMTGEPTVETAVEAVREGAYDYLYKPVHKTGIQQAVDRAAKHKAVLDEKTRLEEANRQYQDNLERMVEERTRALEENKSLYHSLVENLPQYVFRKDIDGRYTFVNQGFCRSLGKTPDDLLGKTSTDLFPPDLAQRYEEDDANVIATGQMCDREGEYPSPGGERRRIRVVKTPVFDAEQRIVGLQGIFWDITERKRLEEELRQAQKMEAIGTLAGGIAHDFNNVLAIMMGYSEVALLHAEKDAKVRAGIEEVIKACRRAADLVRQILSFSRKNEQDRRPLMAAPIFREAVKLLRASLPATIEIRQRIESVGLILGDPTEMHQILMNLATNAYHAMREKGGVLDLDLEDVEVDKACPMGPQGLPAGRYVRLSVRDTGQGIDAGVLERIFDPYFTTKPTGEGTGLGLAVVRGIVMECGGTIQVQSGPGRGTRFEVYFPAIEKKAVEPSDQPSRRVPTGNERVLLVDDEEALLKMGQSMLEHLGYRVTAKSDSRAGLDAFNLEPEQFDAVITDMTMPHLTGLELAKEVLGIRPDMPVILCTGFSDLIDKEGALKVGIKSFLIKPVSLYTLAKSLREALDENRVE